MPRPRVVITDFVADDLAPERAILGDVADVVALNAAREADLAGKVADADAVMTYHVVKLSAKTLDELTRCKVIARGGVGYDNIDWKYARAKGIPVVNVPDYGTEEVADAAVALALALTRGVNLYNSRLRRGLGPWSHTP